MYMYTVYKCWFVCNLSFWSLITYVRSDSNLCWLFTIFCCTNLYKIIIVIVRDVTLHTYSTIQCTKHKMYITQELILKFCPGGSTGSWWMAYHQTAYYTTSIHVHTTRGSVLVVHVHVHLQHALCLHTRAPHTCGSLSKAPSQWLDGLISLS